MKQIVLTFLILPILMMFLCGCPVPPAPLCERDGKHYCRTRERFTSQWYDYYKRAISCMEGECYQDAVADLDEAIKRRPGEKRWANTYGMHFMDYFPHREAGIAYYFLGDYSRAESELETSLRLEPSARAAFYLDKVRMHIMQQEKWRAQEPVLKISSPPRQSDESDERWTREDPVLISGTAEDRQYVSQIMLSGKPVFMESSQQRISFTEKLALHQGRHEIEILARNLLGGEKKQKLIIHVDRSGPLIFIDPPGSDNILSGYVHDEAGISSFIMDSDGAEHNIPLEKDGSFALPLNPESDSASLLAADRLGNQTRTPIRMKKTSRRSPRMLLAQNSIPNRYAARLFSEKDAPEITLNGWPDQATVFKNRIDIEGQAAGYHPIEALSITVTSWESAEDWENKDPESPKPENPVLDFRFPVSKPSHLISFNQSVNLAPGNNRLTIRARDKSGRTRIKEILIIRKIPRIWQSQYRYTLKLFPFDNAEWSDESGGLKTFFFKIPVLWNRARFMEPDKRAWFQYFLSRDFRMGKRFQVLEHEQLQMIFQEHRISGEDMKVFSHDQEEKTFHSLLLADTCEDSKGIEVIARLVDVRTSEIVAVKDVYGESKDPAALKQMAENLAEKFHRAFPMAEGEITDPDPEKTHAVFGQTPVTQGWPLIIYRDGSEKHNPVTGASWGADAEIISDAVMGKSDTVQITNHIKIRTGDKVITR